MKNLIYNEVDFTLRNIVTSDFHVVILPKIHSYNWTVSKLVQYEIVYILISNFGLWLIVFFFQTNLFHQNFILRSITSDFHAAILLEIHSDNWTVSKLVHYEIVYILIGNFGLWLIVFFLTNLFHQNFIGLCLLYLDVSKIGFSSLLQELQN